MVSALSGQSNSPQDPTLSVTSRAVLVDVLVTDSSGKPISGLNQNAFTLTEDGKPQTVTFFEEHAGKPPAPAQMPQLPPNVFSNFSPFPQPDVVNVLLLDSLNTTMNSQGWVNKQALKFLKSARPGQRMAIFTMDLGLHFIQGFNDDPTVLAAALENKKNNPVQASVMLKSQSETVAEQSLIGLMNQVTPNGDGTVSPQASPQAIAALQTFITENDTSRSTDRIFLSLSNLQRLAAFLNGFPGRKNILWFAEKVPTIFAGGTSALGSVETSISPDQAAAEFAAGVASTGSANTGNPALENEIKKTLAMLAAARAAIYPIDPRGAQSAQLYGADTVLPAGIAASGQLIGPAGGASSGSNGGAYFTNSVTSENVERNNDQIAAQIVAEQSGGHAYANINGLADVIAKVSDESNHFYTLSYRPTNEEMNGVYRRIDVKVAGGHYRLSYRRGYFAEEDALPGSSLETERKEIAALAAKNTGAVDPLLPFMSLGMPLSEQILYKVRVNPVAAADNQPQGQVQDKDKSRYKVDFALDTTDLALLPEADGARKGVLNVSLILYDRYGTVVSREDHLVQLNFKPEQYEAVKQVGVQLHALLAVPKGNYWLRTGIFDRASHRVGTMEIPLAAVKPVQTAANSAGTP